MSRARGLKSAVGLRLQALEGCCCTSCVIRQDGDMRFNIGDRLAIRKRGNAFGLFRRWQRVRQRSVMLWARLQVEALEDRAVPATIIVDTLSDVVARDGLTSLREAILQANDK